MRGRDVILEGVEIVYPNGYTAVRPTDLHVEGGEFFSILGPSGCGKTTVLRAVSGFVEPSRGRILIGNQDQTGRPPYLRPTALIFQSLALFPLMTVRENVAFGLEARGIRRAERNRRADALLAMVALSDQADKRTDELSGGQRQRVAIARALAVEPAVLLLDEPLSALDLKLRSHMRAELRAIQKSTGVTFIYITHDQGEALTMSDRIAIMDRGRIEQVGTCDAIYSDPRTAFAASFVGESNMLAGRIAAAADGLARLDTALGPLWGRNPRGLSPGAAGLIFVRPEAMRFDPASNAIVARLERRDLEGAFVTYVFHAGEALLSVQLPNVGAPLVPGEAPIRLGFEPRDAVVLPEGPLAKTGRELVA